ncbi:MAG: hypothetical protein ACPG4Z_07785 [Chitinophagales bacterium]
MERVIGKYGNENSEFVLIVLAGIHGNEKAGIGTLNYLFDFFDKKKAKVNAQVIGIAGNTKAIEENTRFIHKDLNRQWYSSKITKLKALPHGMLNTAEDHEQKEMIAVLETLFEENKNKQIFLVDLHTTSAKGGCFSITNPVAKSSEYACMIPVPVINGMTTILKGTTLEFCYDNDIAAIAYEAGQHVEPASVERMKAGLISVLYKNNCISKEIYDCFLEEIRELEDFNAQLPKAVNVIYRHPVDDEDEFVMKKGYSNFQPIAKGEQLATDKNGAILSPHDGLILMPLYQKKGSDGFFIVAEL